MKTLNKIQLVGYLGADPKFITLKDGTPMARMRMATDTFIPQKDGALKKHTDWHTINLWGPHQIEKVRNYLVKGSHVMVDGRLLSRNYTDKDGRIRDVTEIRANYLIDLDR